MQTHTFFNANQIRSLTIFVSCFFYISQIAQASFMPESFSSKFEQKYTSVLRGKEKKGEGTIDYKYPGQIRFETNHPSKVIFVSNGVKAWYYRAPFIEGEKGEVSETPAKDGAGLYTKFFDSLKNGLVSNSLYDVVQEKNADKNNREVQIRFSKKTSEEIGIKESIIKFKTPESQKFENIESISLIYPDSKKSVLTLIDLKTNISHNYEKFNFVIPPNTTITR